MFRFLLGASFRIRASLLGMALIACDVPTDSTRRLEPTSLPGKGITVVALDHRTLAGIRTNDGTTLWRYRPPNPSVVSSVARPLGYLTCAPVLAKNGVLVVGYSDRIVAIEADTGLERWSEQYAPHHDGVQCPAVSADSGVIFIDTHKTQVRSVIKKLDLNGSLRWHTILPDVGLVQGAPQVDDQTGDIVVEASSSTVGLSPEGLVNWVRPRAETASH